MTGDDVVKIRAGLGWNGSQFASLLGVHASTVYRWEEVKGAELKIEPLQRQLLSVLRGELKRRGAGSARLAEQMHDALAVGGSLRALYVLLKSVYSPAPPATAPVAPVEDSKG